MKQVSFVCCYTCSKQIDELKNSVLNFQSYQIEWVLIDNSHSQYKSASSALNAGAKKCTQDIIVFLHQDIEFDNEHTLEFICQEAEKGKIVGVAGRKANGGSLVTTIDDGVNRERHHSFLFQSSCEEVMTCDECLIAMSRETYNLVGGFNEKDFDGWHFYGVDLCLRAKKKGIQSCVVPSKLWHKSKGSKDKNWRFYEQRLRRIYKKDYKVIYYACGKCYTNLMKYFFMRLFQSTRKRIRRVKKSLFS